MMRASDIARRLGKPWNGRLLTADCPSCGYTAGLTLKEKGGRPLVHCHACQDQHAVWNAVSSYPSLGQSARWRSHRSRSTTVAAGATVARGNAEKVRHIMAGWWGTARPADEASLPYWGLRGLAYPVPATVRVHPGLRHASDGVRRPVMLAAVTCWPGDDIVAVHRTFLTEDRQRKADVDPARMSFGALTSGAVRLAEAGEHLILGEGIETTASAMMLSGLPGWACLSTSGLQSVILPEAVRTVVIAADQDPAGRKAACAAADRLAREGRRVRLVFPPAPHNDFNDVIREAGR